MTFWTYGRCIYGITHRKISICFTGVSLTWATWIGHPTSDPPWSLNPQGWLVSNLRKANGTICPSDILFTISWQNSQTFSSHCMNRALPSDSFYGNLSYYCYRKLVSVSVDGRREYLTPRRQHMFAWRGGISSSRFMFTVITVIHELNLCVCVIVKTETSMLHVYAFQCILITKLATNILKRFVVYYFFSKKVLLFKNQFWKHTPGQLC